jgi:hypothetical protein
MNSVDQGYVYPPFSGIFPNGVSFKDFIITNSYKQPPHHKIGDGGFGNVFLLQFPNQNFILKEIAIPDAEHLKLVQTEIAALKHVRGKWYAVQLLAYGILKPSGAPGIAYILYPYIPGRTLDIYLRENHSEQDEKLIYYYIIEAIHQLHTNAGIIHGDIKPPNIWIPNDPRILPFLLDFGVVQSIHDKIAHRVGTNFYWSRRRSRNNRNQAITTGINWIALAKTFGREYGNTGFLSVPPLHNRFEKLYHAKNENTIRKNNINRALNLQIVTPDIITPNQSNMNTSGVGGKRTKKRYTRRR